MTDGSEEPRLRRLAEELQESGLPLEPHPSPSRTLLLEEVDRALRPPVHERRVPSGGAILEPRADPAGWSAGTGLRFDRSPVGAGTLTDARWFVDGLSSWLIRRAGGGDDWMLFDRPAGSERDLVVLADVLEATVVQRHPAGVVRIVGSFGVLRWAGVAWDFEPPVTWWLKVVGAGSFDGEPEVLEALLRFAVHDLGSLGIGATFVYDPRNADQAAGAAGGGVEERLPPPPPLRIRRPTHLAPLRHALMQVDGAAVFDGEGVLRRLGVRLVPSARAERTVPALGGTRHTSAIRYSHDNPTATVIVVSEDGPVSVLRDGRVLDAPPPPGTAGRTRQK